MSSFYRVRQGCSVEERNSHRFVKFKIHFSLVPSQYKFTRSQYTMGHQVAQYSHNNVVLEAKMSSFYRVRQGCSVQERNSHRFVKFKIHFPLVPSQYKFTRSQYTMGHQVTQYSHKNVVLEAKMSSFYRVRQGCSVEERNSHRFVKFKIHFSLVPSQYKFTRSQYTMGHQVAQYSHNNVVLEAKMSSFCRVRQGCSVQERNSHRFVKFKIHFSLMASRYNFTRLQYTMGHQVTQYSLKIVSQALKCLQLLELGMDLLSNSKIATDQSRRKIHSLDYVVRRPHYIMVVYSVVQWVISITNVPLCRFANGLVYMQFANVFQFLNQSRILRYLNISCLFIFLIKSYF